MINYVFAIRNVEAGTTSYMQVALENNAAAFKFRSELLGRCQMTKRGGFTVRFFEAREQETK